MRISKARKLRLLALLGVIVLGFVLTSGGQESEQASINPELPKQIIEDIVPGEAYGLIQNNKGNQDFILLDIRTPEEYRDGYIEDAINLDFYSETFRDELNKLDKDKKYLVYCRSGRRSGISLGTMKELGFREAYNMAGGIIQWEAEGLPTIK